jgi:Spy/CpxP family protein refolding chaperone
LKHDLPQKQALPLPCSKARRGIASVTRDIPEGEELHYNRMKIEASAKKGIRMNKNRFAKRLAVAAGFFFLCAAATGLARAQDSPPSPSSPPTPTSPVLTPRKPLPMARSKKAPSAADDFAGLQFTNEQKAKIDQIHQDMKLRTDAVAKDGKLTPEQRDAMLAGYERMERGQVFKVLTTEQQKEVLKKVHARHVAEQDAQKKKQPLPPTQPK